MPVLELALGDQAGLKLTSGVPGNFFFFLKTQTKLDPKHPTGLEVIKLGSLMLVETVLG